LWDDSLHKAALSAAQPEGVGHLRGRGRFLFAHLTCVIGLPNVRCEASERKGGAYYSRGEDSGSNAFLASIIERVPAMVFVKNADTLRFELFNNAGEELLGISRAALIGKSDVDFFPPEQVAFFAEMDRGVLDGRKLLSIPREPINTAHGQRWLYTKKIPVLDGRGVVRHLLGVSLDISECHDLGDALRRKRVELQPLISALRQRSSAMRSMLDNFEEGLSFGYDRFCSPPEPAADSSAPDLVELHARYGAAILGRCRRLLGDSEAGKDAAQEVFVRALRYRARWPDASAMGPWLFRIATNYCLNELRGRQVRARAWSLSAAQASSSPEACVAARSELGRIMERLPARARDVVRLTYVEGMLQHEVAEALGVSRRTVLNDLNCLRSRRERR
jgi:RNA polymerase sigma factor (sigma-70 family)